MKSRVAALGDACYSYHLGPSPNPGLRPRVQRTFLTPLFCKLLAGISAVQVHCRYTSIVSHCCTRRPTSIHPGCCHLSAQLLTHRMPRGLQQVPGNFCLRVLGCTHVRLQAVLLNLWCDRALKLAGDANRGSVGMPVSLSSSVLRCHIPLHRDTTCRVHGRLVADSVLSPGLIWADIVEPAATTHARFLIVFIADLCRSMYSSGRHHALSLNCSM